ncbi:MAG: AbrB/MazE/SpoVT family DNA-binding domain-containing protein [Sideroxydans sp.]|nr:AbrB/MazE/SpoVT family DNA-binding domain-containing protein [Sideroxydans sp.]NOT99019.1 AbrB/MazE/SpoVT family DNA-binding domain-containing protein [Sideroxydans sp.]
MIVTVSEKGQLVIPAEIRRLLGITPGTRLNVLPDASGFRALVDDARKTKSAADCVGIACYTGKAISIEEMDAAKFANKP